MLEFARNAFRGFYNFILWVCLIVFVIVGGITGSSIGDGAGAIIGIILGIFIGIASIIIGGGLIATFLNIDKNLEVIANNTSQIGILNSPNRVYTGSKYMKKCKRCQNQIDDDYTACPQCGNSTFD